MNLDNVMSADGTMIVIALGACVDNGDGTIVFVMLWMSQRHL